MAQQNNISTLDGMFKAQYGELKNAIPENAILTKMVDFDKSASPGESYNTVVILGAEHGATHFNPGEMPTLNASIAGATKKASVDGKQLLYRGQLDNETIAKASSSEKAFRQSTKHLVMSLMESATRRLEINMLYGQVGIGTVSALSGQVITISAASFAEGIFAGAESGMVIDVYQAATSSIRQANLIITAVDLDARTLTVSGTTTGIIAGDTLYFQGAYGKEMAGLQKIIQNTGSLFGIDASVYSLWKGSSVNAAGPISMALVQRSVARAVVRGLKRDVTVLVHPAQWNVLNADQSALRNYTDSKSTAQNGFDAIEYRSVNGKISVIAHPCVKNGEIFIVPMDSLKRVGPSDLTFDGDQQGLDSGIFMKVPNQPAYELRLYSHQALFCDSPAQCVFVNGITPV